MAWVKHNETSAIITADTGSQTVTLPGTPAENDLVIIAVAGDISCQNSIPSDYTRPENATGANPGACFGYKVLGATPDTTVAILRSATVLKSCVIQIWRGGNAASILDSAYVGAATGTSNAPDPPAIDTNFANALVVAIAFLDDDDTTVSSYPSTYTNGVTGNTGQASTNVGSTVAMASKVIATPTAGVDPGAYTMGSSDAWLAATIAFREADTTLSREIPAEGLTPADTATPALQLARDVTAENFKLDDIGQGATQLLGVVHVVDGPPLPELSEYSTISRDVSAESLKVSDSAEPALETLLLIGEPGDDALKISDAASPALDLSAEVSDSLEVTDTAEPAIEWAVHVTDDSLKVSETATPALDLSALVDDEPIHVTESAEPALIDEGVLSRNVDAEALKVTESADPSLVDEGSLSITVDAENLKLDDIGQGAIQLLGVIHVVDVLTQPELIEQGDGNLAREVAAEGLTLADAVDSYAELLTDEYLTLTDSPVVASLRTYLLIADESLKLSDAATPAVHLAATATDSLKVSDTATPALELSAVVTESVHVTDSPEAVIADEGTLTINVPAENLKLSDAALSDISVIEAGLLTESLKLTDDPALATRIEPDALSRVVADDSLKLSDTATAELQLAASVSDALKVSDAVDAALELTASVSESLKLSDSAQAEMQRVVSVSESLKLADEAFAVLLDAGTIAALLQEPIKLADVVSVTLNPLETSATEGLKLSDSATAALTLAATAPAENLKLTDGPALTDLIAVDTQTVSAQESIRISEALTASFDVLETSPSETLKLTDTVSRQIAGATSIIELTGTYALTLELEGTYMPVIELTGTVEL